MSIVALANCIVCRKPILPGQEAEVNKARHESCTGARPMQPDEPPDIKAMFPNSKLDAFTVQTIIALIQERTHWERTAAGKQIIIDTMTFQHDQLEMVTGQLNKLAKFFLENYPEEIKDTALAQLSSADMAIHLMVKYKREAEAAKTAESVYEAAVKRLFPKGVPPDPPPPSRTYPEEPSLFERIFGKSRW